MLAGGARCACYKTTMDAERHLLVVDDDAEIRNLLSAYLRRNGYRVTALPDGRSLRRAVEVGGVDLVVLDLMLPGRDGLELCRELRVVSDVPVIMLTARGEPIDRIVGLEIGADDYVAKPFEPRELLARIKNILRRSEGRPTEPDPDEVAAFEFGDWTLETVSRSLVRRGATPVTLTGAEYRLLALLLAAGNRVVNRVQLGEQLRGKSNDPFDRSIDVRVSRLRQLMGDDARDPEIVKTVYGEGYVIGVPVKVQRR